ncbi:hypothetical protein BH23PLA1_BH23PLA1_19660 [soil metagenome]
MASGEHQRIDVEGLERALRATEPGVVLVEPRVLRRVIKHDRKMTSLGVQVPHRKSYVIDAAEAAEIVERDELGLDVRAELAGDLLLLPRPTPEALAERSADQILRKYWRLLFHARVDLAIEHRIRDGSLDPIEVRRRIHQIGQTEFDEIRSVLRHEDYLLPPRDRKMIYREFAAVYLELKYFAPSLLPLYFPALTDHEAVETVLFQDVDAEALLAGTRPEGAPSTPCHLRDRSSDHDFDADADNEPNEATRSDAEKPSERKQRALIRQADRAHRQGNVVRAAILQAQAARRRPRPQGEGSPGTSRAGWGELAYLAERLGEALGLDPEETDAWRRALPALLGPAARWGWTVEARLLFDLQKVCNDYERDIYTIDLVEWALSLGRRPVKRLLPLQTEVLTCKHLHSSFRRLRSARLPDAARARLARLLGEALHRAEHALRERCRPVLAGVLEETGLRPRNVPERVGFAKLVEELLDRIVERGFLTMGDLRDGLARNQVKLPDLTGPRQFFAGDRLLRANRRLAVELDGIYHRGEVYMRWLQRFSSLGFGTRLGRFLTQYLVLPFGGAYVGLKGIDHAAHLIGDAGKLLTGAGTSPSEDQVHDADHSPAGVIADGKAEGADHLPEGPAEVIARPGEAVAAEMVEPADPSPLGADRSTDDSSAATIAGAEPPEAILPEDEPPIDTELTEEAFAEAAASAHHEAYLIPDEIFPFVLLITGLFLLGLIHAPRFRALVVRVLRDSFRLVKGILIDLPSWFLHLRYVRLLMESRAFLILWRSFAKPVLPGVLTWMVLVLIGFRPREALIYGVTVFALIGLFLNIRVGRDLEEITADRMVRTWRMIRANLIIGLFRLVMDFFNRLLEVVDRLLYTVDEWLRFRGGEGHLSYVAKALLGIVWFYVTYVIRFAINLLVEPQINPIKHFPVVTVSHKLLAPILFALIVGAPGAPSQIQQTLGPKDAYTIFTVTQLLLPGIFGFLVWELKENWRLYRANRPRDLRPVLIGHHGETMLRLLRPGLHSGTLPKLFARLRRAERRALRHGQRRAVRKLKVALHHVEASVSHFAERELLALLRESRSLGQVPIEVGQVEVSVNRVRFELRAPDLDGESVWLAFEEQSGWLVAGVVEAGWIASIEEDSLRELGAALAGFYKLAGVDFVRQQVEARLGGPPSPPYDIADEGLIVWPGEGFATEVHYDLRNDRAVVLRPGPGRVEIPSDLGERLLLRPIPIPWDRWVETWEKDRAGQSPPRPYLEDVRVLPLKPGVETAG